MLNMLWHQNANISIRKCLCRVALLLNERAFYSITIDHANRFELGPKSQIAIFILNHFFFIWFFFVVLGRLPNRQHSSANETVARR